MEAVVREGCATGPEHLLHSSTRNCGNVESCVKHGLPCDERLGGSERPSILG
jgi:hypothetical protein